MILVLWWHLGFRHSISRSVTTMKCIVPFTNSQWFHHFLFNTSSPSHRTRRKSAPRVTTSAVTSRKVLESFPTAFTSMSLWMPQLQSLLLLFRPRIPSHRHCPRRLDIPRTSRASTAASSERLLVLSPLPTPLASHASSYLPSGSLTALTQTPDMRTTPGNPAQLDMPPVPLAALTTLACSCSAPHRHHPHPQLQQQLPHL